MSVLSQRHSIICYRGISAPEHVKELFDCLNAIYKPYMYQLMSTVQFPWSKIFEEQILMHSCTQKSMSVWIKNSKEIYLMMIVNMESLIRGKTEKEPVKENGQTESIMFRIILMLHTKMWKCIVILTNSRHYHSVVPIQSLMEKGGWVSIIIYALIQI